MKFSTIMAISLAAFALITGNLLSAISFIGRTGINFFYREYGFFKSWWKAALVVYIVWLILYFIQSYLSRKANKATARMINLAALLTAVLGLAFSYYDFQNTLSHKFLGERFHLGVYLFWIVWMGISILRLVKRKDIPETIA